MKAIAAAPLNLRGPADLVYSLTNPAGKPIALRLMLEN
jgi:hypothetical protein